MSVISWVREFRRQRRADRVVEIGRQLRVLESERAQYDATTIPELDDQIRRLTNERDRHLEFIRNTARRG